MRNIFFALITLFAVSASAATLDEKTTSFIIKQAINFGVFFLLIAWLVKSKASPALKQFKEDYLAKSQEAESKLAAAKEERDSLAAKIAKLETSFKSEMEQASKQAESAYKDKLLKTKESIGFMNKDLESQIEGLKRSQATQLKDTLMSKSIEELKAELGSDMDEQLLINLQNKFVENMDVRA